MNCPKCKTKLPIIRFTTSLRQMFWGGWTCPNPQCGTEMDRKGKIIKK